MTQPFTRSQAVVTLADGSKQTFPLSYHVLHRSGDFVGGWYAGLVVDKNNKPILQSAPVKGKVARGPFFSAGADGTSLLVVPGAKVNGVKGHTVFLINHLEYETEADNIDPTKKPVELYAQLPMAMNLTVLDQDPKTGKLTPVKMSNVDFAGVDGLWIPCNGSTTPWMTHLGGEEYEPNAQYFETRPLEAMNLYFGTPGKTAAQGGANPYHYGHLVEVKVGPDGATTVTKHYAMGRLAFELGDVMPDRRTVYLGDDGDDVIRAMFVADKPEDLSAGTLYAAKWTQTSGNNFGAAKLTWIKLGHASDAEIKALVDKGIKFSDIWETSKAPKAGFKPALCLCRHRRQERARLLQAEARHGEGRRLPGDAPLRRLSRRHHRVHQDGRPGPQRRRQEALHGDQLRAQRHDRRQEQESAAGRHPACRRPEGPHLRRGL